MNVSRNAHLTVIVTLLLVASAPADIIIENFTGPTLDADLWSEFDIPGDGVTVEQINDRLEFSSLGLPGLAGIFGEPWALDTSADFDISIEYSMTFGNPGATDTGMIIALYAGGSPAGLTIDDRLELRVFRLGSLFWYEWAFFANGQLVDSDFRQTTASINELSISYNATTDTVIVTSKLPTNDPIAFGVAGLAALTGADELQLFLGGFMDGITIAVDGSDAWWDTLRVIGDVVDDPGPTEPIALDARDDAAWFRRGDSGGDRFGWATRFAGDVDGDGFNDIVVGAPRNDDGGNNAGTATVYSGVDGTQVLQVTGAGSGDQMGYAVDGAGDWNGDGRADVIVAAARAGADRGSVFVYSGMAPHGLLWSKDGEADGDYFGYAVAGVGDVNNDGFDDVLVGAPFNDQGGPNAGRAYVYLGGSGALWHRKTGTETGEQFGRAVGCAGDVDDDGDPDYIVGAPLNDRRGPNSGQVSVYSGDAGTRLHVLRRESGDRLGWSVDGAGDVDADGHDDILVGAYSNDTGGANAGAAIIYSGLDGSVLLELFGVSAGDRFGSAVTSIGDLDGDGVGEIAVAAPRHDTAGVDSGRLYILCSVTGTLLATIDGENAGDEYGVSLDGDPAAIELVAGSWKLSSFGLTNRGTAYRYELGGD